MESLRYVLRHHRLASSFSSGIKKHPLTGTDPNKSSTHLFPDGDLVHRPVLATPRTGLIVTLSTNHTSVKMSSSRPNGERNPRSRPLLIGDLASSAAAGLDLPRTLTVDEDDPSSQITDSEAEDDDTEVDLDDAEDTLVNDSDRLDGGPNTPSRKRTYVRTFPELSPAEERDVKQILFQRLKRGDLKLDYELKVAMNIAAPRDDFDDDDDDKEEEEEEEGENNAEGRANDAMEEIDVNKEILVCNHSFPPHVCRVT